MSKIDEQVKEVETDGTKKHKHNSKTHADSDVKPAEDHNKSSTHEIETVPQTNSEEKHEEEKSTTSAPQITVTFDTVPETAASPVTKSSSPVASTSLGTGTTNEGRAGIKRSRRRIRESTITSITASSLGISSGSSYDEEEMEEYYDDEELVMPAQDEAMGKVSVSGNV